MAVTIAEYLGQRTDSLLPIQPVDIPPPGQGNQAPLCPFNDQPCIKMSKRENAKPPICSLRKPNGQFYIVCENRLLSTDIARLSNHQKTMLLEAGKALFGSTLQPNQLAIKSEVTIQTLEPNPDNPHQGRPRADFILAVADDAFQTLGSRRFIMEVQGGGETNNTGSITRHVESWSQNLSQANQLLSASIKKAGTIETNAWRRLQEQIFTKATTAQKSGYGFSSLIGRVGFNYLKGVIPSLDEIRLDPLKDDWDTALLVFDERNLSEDEKPVGAVPLQLDSELSIYTRLDSLLQKMTSRGRPDLSAFSGKFVTLSGEVVEIPKE